MTPRPGHASSKYPVAIPSRVRSILEYRRLDTSLRARIYARRHAAGWSYSPKDPHDAEACAWIDGQAEKHGKARWVKYPGGGRLGQWVVEKSKTEPR